MNHAAGVQEQPVHGDTCTQSQNLIDNTALLMQPGSLNSGMQPVQLAVFVKGHAAQPLGCKTRSKNTVLSLPLWKDGQNPSFKNENRHIMLRPLYHPRKHSRYRGGWVDHSRSEGRDNGNNSCREWYPGRSARNYPLY